MNINQLFEQFVGGPADSNRQGGHGTTTSGVGDMLTRLTQSRAGSFAGGLATGGLLGTLMGSKKMRKKARKMAGGALGYGGSAVLGALALKAYQNWQAGQTAPAQAAGAQPMQLTLVKAMVAAANADGHIDKDEQVAVFDAVDTMALDAESKALIFDLLRNPPTVVQIAGYADGLEQASEIYLASRLAIDPDEPSEYRYLDDLARAMELPADLVDEIELQLEPVQPANTARGDQVGAFGRDRSPAASVPESGAEVRNSGRL